MSYDQQTQLIIAQLQAEDQRKRSERSRQESDEYRAKGLLKSPPYRTPATKPTLSKMGFFRSTQPLPSKDTQKSATKSRSSFSRSKSSKATKDPEPAMAKHETAAEKHEAAAKRHEELRKQEEAKQRQETKEALKCAAATAKKADEAQKAGDALKSEAEKKAEEAKNHKKALKHEAAKKKKEAKKEKKAKKREAAKKKEEAKQNKGSKSATPSLKSKKSGFFSRIKTYEPAPPPVNLTKTPTREIDSSQIAGLKLKMKKGADITLLEVPKESKKDQRPKLSTANSANSCDCVDE
ncbi:hypothetical protein QTJ16_001821 [Diplocarpon rosae]|uniref:Uncharacterized protein n=1 Tax=Diplocarpon rosae TaxID=946125 RepID=A0AAD9T279_9HELO|nr:hypothetical protein QTJ16_001821 [Diplocarpon rosae]